MKEVAVLAVDAGGTGCRAALCNRDGQIIGFAQGTSCNYHSIGAEKATENLIELLSALVKQQALRVNCVVLGLAGLDTKKDETILTDIVSQALHGANINADMIHLYNDAMLTLKGSVGQHHGVLIAAGTGSIACGTTSEGLETRVGGWGYLVGDEGSGYSIGKAAITHVLKSYDNQENSSGISAAILHELSLANVDELINWVYSSHFSVARVAALTPIIVKLAEDGDWQGEKIIHCACQELSDLALTVIKKLGLQNAKFNLVLSGGIFKNAMIHRQVVNLLASKYQGLQIVAPSQPIYAGLSYGLMRLGIDNSIVLSPLPDCLN